MKRTILLALIFAASAAHAQIRDVRPSSDPAFWVSGGVAAFSADGINDGNSGSAWDFSGTHIQYRASLEKAIQNQTTIGLALSYMNMPFTYYGQALAANSCTQCNAHMKFYAAAISLHVGGGLGLHQVLEASAGLNHYRDFVNDDNGGALKPLDGNTDAAFNFGYGFGYNFSRSQEVFLVQDYGLSLHEKDGLQNSQSNTLTMRTTRIGYRVGFGSRRPLR